MRTGKPLKKFPIDDAYDVILIGSGVHTSQTPVTVSSRSYRSPIVPYTVTVCCVVVLNAAPPVPVLAAVASMLIARALFRSVPPPGACLATYLC